MAINQTTPCPAKQATAISDGAVAAARVQSDGDIYLLATAANTAPTSTDGGVLLRAGTILTADLALADLFPGVTGPYYLWAWPSLGSCNVSSSHA